MHVVKYLTKNEFKVSTGQSTEKRVQENVHHLLNW